MNVVYFVVVVVLLSDLFAVRVGDDSNRMVFFEIWPATKYPTVNSRSETVLFDFSLMLTTTLFY